MVEKSTAKAIHLLRRLMKCYMDRKKDFHMVLINLEKACDGALREVLCCCSEKKGIPFGYIRVI